jgi:hypothetical protein
MISDFTKGDLMHRGVLYWAIDAPLFKPKAIMSLNIPIFTMHNSKSPICLVILHF